MGGDEGGMTTNITVTWGPGVDPGTEKGLWLENWLGPQFSKYPIPLLICWF